MKFLQFIFSTLFILGLSSVVVFPGDRKTKIKILVFLTKLSSRRDAQLFELFFIKFFESLDASLLEVSFHRLKATRSQVSNVLFGFTSAYLQSLPAFFSYPSLMHQSPNRLPEHVEIIFIKARSVTISQLVKQGMTLDDAFLLYSACSAVALPRLTEFCRSQAVSFFDVSSRRDA
jgi:hypothetical protein